jgi:hypothetical protein
MSERSLQRISLSLSMSMLKLNVTSFFYKFKGYTWLQMMESVPTTYFWKTLNLSRTTVTSVSSFWFSGTSICQKADRRLTKKVALCYP